MSGGYFEEKSVGSFEAQRIIWKLGDTQIDLDILKIFLYRSSFLKIGSEIQLDTTRKGVIVGFANFIEDPTSPIIKLSNGKMIDLSKIPAK